MNITLLDTNVVSFILKGYSRAKDYAPFLLEQHLAISFMTVAELYQWAAIRQWGTHRVQQLEQTISTTYIVLSFDIALCQRWGEVRALRRGMGKPISPEDAWIAATSLQYNLPLVTHNPKDFEDIPDLEIITVI